MFTQIRKRDGRIVDFDKERIISALYKAFEGAGERDGEYCAGLAETVIQKLDEKYKGQKNAIPSIEEAQDLVEETLIENGYAKVAKAYILYRQKRAEIRKEKQMVLDKEEIDDIDKRFDINALRVLRSRYLKKNAEGRVVESPAELFSRVAAHAVLPNILYDKQVFKKPKKMMPVMKILEEECGEGKEGEEEEKKLEKFLKMEGKLKIGGFLLNSFHIKFFYHAFRRFEKNGLAKIDFDTLIKKLANGDFNRYEKTINDFYELMVFRKFMPNTPTIANFGSFLGMGSACFVLDIDDSIESIMDTLKNASVIFKSGGGLGYNFSKLRPKGDFIQKTGGTSSGPLSFMALFDTMTEVVKQGGIRRGANMGILNSNHPDIEDFISAKEGNKALRNFNISVLLMHDFWDFYNKDKPYPLINPRTGEVQKYVSPKILFDKIVYQAWESAEPGVIFQDYINENNPFSKTLGPIITTNPCGELPLYPRESCNLGSINLWAFVKKENKVNGKKYFDWEDFEKTVKTATRFLDNVIDINHFPLKAIEAMSLNTRKIGLGVMGLGDLFYELDLSYNSSAGLKFMEKIAEFLNYHSKMESIELAKERGSFPYFDKSFYLEGRLPFSAAASSEKDSWDFNWSNVAKDIKTYGIRNSVTTVVAPTGSISMIAGCSSGIEPVYSLIFQKNVAVGSFYYIDPVFEQATLREGLFDENLIKHILDNNGSLQNISYIPPKMKKVFVTAHDISPEDHIKALAAFQKWVDSSISKTINFPHDASVEQMKKVYLLAYELKCKDVTVFRDKSIQNQVLVTKNISEKKSDDIDKKQQKDKSINSREKEGSDNFIRIKDEKAQGMVVYLDSSATSREVEAGPKNGLKNCPNCSSTLSFKEGCVSCSVCGWGLCS